MATGLKVAEHAHRKTLTDEVHARPYELIASPARASFIAMLTGEEEGRSDQAALSELCAHYGIAPPDAGAIHFSADLGPFRLRWERHTEFSSWGFIHEGAADAPFDEPAIAAVPETWLAALPGEALVAMHVALLPVGERARGMEELARFFDGNTVAGSHVAGGAARAWTDFRVHADGFSRTLIEDVDLRSRQAGRLMQRLVEIETYRMLALLAFPEARRLGGRVRRIERRLAQLTRRMNDAAGFEDEKDLLDELTRIAALVERMATATDYRFSASRAYYALVTRRIDELREQRQAGIQTFAEFMERRLAPAMRTCESVRERLAALSIRTGRAASLLRVRVNLALEQQNRDLLESMNRRARLQLRLQETVEGLSIVVLSYYSVGLVGYALKAAKAGGAGINVELLTGVSIPVVVAAVYFGIRRMRAALTRRAAEEG